MSKFMRRYMITAGVCIIVGLGFCLAGWLLGGEPGFGIRSDGLYTNQDMREAHNRKLVVLEKTEIEPFTGMDIRLDYNDIKVAPSGDDHYYLEYRLYAGKTEPRYEVTGGVLSLTCVRESDEFFYTGTTGFFVAEENSLKNGQAIIYVPEERPMNQVKLYNKDGSVEYDGPDAKTLDITSLYGSVELKHKTAETVLVNMADGTLTCDGGSFADLSVVNQYGEINLNQITASAMSIDASDAGITMNGINVDHITIVNNYGSISSDTMETDSIMVKQSDGQCTMKSITVRDGEFENKYGDMKLYLTGDETDYNYELSMKYGTIRLNERNFEEQSVHENHGADRNIKMTASDGAVTIRTGGLE